MYDGDYTQHIKDREIFLAKVDGKVNIILSASKLSESFKKLLEAINKDVDLRMAFNMARGGVV